MLCPQCNRRFDENAGSCPRCGADRGLVKTSTILISKGESRSVYRSVEDVPDSLKRQLFDSTNSLNSATIIIADRQGREEVAKVIRNLPGDGEQNAAGRARTLALQTIGALALLAAIALVWFLFRS